MTETPILFYFILFYLFIASRLFRWWNVWSAKSFFFCFLGWHLQYMEVPRLRVKSELQLPAYVTATAALEPRPTEQGQDKTCILMDTSQIRFRCTMMGTPWSAKSYQTSSTPLPLQGKGKIIIEKTKFFPLRLRNLFSLNKC